jgi:glycosyltransferase involved in cell wall biosynthesis
MTVARPNETASVQENAGSRHREMLQPDQPRVLIVIYSLGLGGTEKHLSLVLPALKKRGFNLIVFNISGVQDAEIFSLLVQAEIEVRGPALVQDGKRMSAQRLLSSMFRLLKCCALERPHIIHFFLPRAYLIGAPLALMTRVPTRVMSRRSLNNYQAKYPILTKLERYLHRKMTAISGNSKAVINQLRHEAHIAPEKLYLIYNGIPLNSREVSREEKRAANGITAECLVLIVVANLVFYKGHADLLDALNEARAALPEKWVLLIVGGDSGVANRLKERVRKLLLEDHVRFLGLRRDIPELLSISDIAILVSHEEGFSNAVLEAMASGLPVIASNVGGNPEAVIEGSTGLLVVPKTPSVLAQAIVRLANDPAERQRMGARGRARVEKNFSLEACVSGYEALYRSIL